LPSQIVFIVRFNHGVLPARPGRENSGIDETRHFYLSPEAHLEEERRLAYGKLRLQLSQANPIDGSYAFFCIVSITRAKEALYISYSLTNSWGQPCAASPFLAELPTSLLEITQSDTVLPSTQNSTAQQPAAEPAVFTSASDLIRKEKEAEAKKKEEYQMLKSKFFSQATAAPVAVAKSSIFPKLKTPKRLSLTKRKRQTDNEESEHPPLSPEPKTQLESDSVTTTDTLPKESVSTHSEATEEKTGGTTTLPSTDGSEEISLDSEPEQRYEQNAEEKEEEEKEEKPASQTVEEKQEKQEGSPKRKLVESSEKHQWLLKPTKRRKRFLSDDGDNLDDLLSTNSANEEGSEAALADSEAQEEESEKQQPGNGNGKEGKEEKKQEEDVGEKNSQDGEKRGKGEKEAEQEKVSRQSVTSSPSKQASTTEGLKRASSQRLPAQKKTTAASKKKAQSDTDSKHRPITAYFLSQKKTGDSTAPATPSPNGGTTKTTTTGGAGEKRKAEKEVSTTSAPKDEANKKQKVSKATTSEKKKERAKEKEKDKKEEKGKKKTIEKGKTSEKIAKGKEKEKEEEKAKEKDDDRDSEQKIAARKRVEAAELDGELGPCFSSGEACPNCETWLQKPDIESGWWHRKDGEKEDYHTDVTTKCPKCSLRFIATMTVGYHSTPKGAGAETAGDTTTTTTRTDETCPFLGPKQLAYRAKVRMKKEGSQSFRPVVLAEKDKMLFWNLVNTFGSLKQALLEIFPDKNLNGIFL